MNSDQSTRIWRTARGTQTPAYEQVHFHIDADGWPFVCDYESCDSPGAAIDDGPWQAIGDVRSQALASARSVASGDSRSAARRGPIRRMREVIHA